MSWKEFTDIAYTVMLLFNALLYLPQIRLLFRNKSSEGLSLGTFVGFLFVQCSAVGNGIYYHDPALIIGQSAGVLANSVLIYLIVHYRIKKSSGGL